MGLFVGGGGVRRYLLPIFEDLGDWEMLLRKGQFIIRILILN